VLYKRAMSELMHIKAKKLPCFTQPALLRKIMTILECHHFRLTARRSVIDLFDKSVMRQVVLEEESSEEDTGNENDSASEGRTERQRSISDASAP